MKPNEKWAESLKPGALAGLVFGNMWYPIVFGKYKSYSQVDGGLEYYDLYWYDQNKDKKISDWVKERAETVINQTSKLPYCFIISNAKSRLFPFPEKLLTGGQKHLYNAYKKRFNYEY